MSSTRVYVGGLSQRSRESDVERFFKKCGRIREISMKNGYAFVEFEDHRDADDAVYECDGKDLMGDRVSVEIARGTPHGRDRDRWGNGGGGGGGGRRSRSPPGRRGGGGGGRGGGDRGGGGDRPVWMEKYGPPTRTDYKLIVENLSSRVSWQDLKDYMRQAGEVTYADAHKNRRNEGVVEFGSYEDLRTALDKLDGTELNGKRIKLVELGGRKKSHSRSPSRSRSRTPPPRRKRSASPRSRSRSRSVDRRKSGRDSSSPRSPPPTGRNDRPRTRSRTPLSPDDRNKSDRDRSGDRNDRERSGDRNRSGDRKRGGDRNERDRSGDRNDRDRSGDRNGDGNDRARKDRERNDSGRSGDRNDRDRNGSSSPHKRQRSENGDEDRD